MTSLCESLDFLLRFLVSVGCQHHRRANYVANRYIFILAFDGGKKEKGDLKHLYKFVFLFFCFLLSSISVNAGIDVVFCDEGSRGSCVTRADRNGFDCTHGGGVKDCNGTTIKTIDFEIGG